MRPDDRVVVEIVDLVIAGPRALEPRFLESRDARGERGHSSVSNGA